MNYILFLSFLPKFISIWRFVSSEIFSKNFSLKRIGFSYWWLSRIHIYFPNFINAMYIQCLRKVKLLWRSENRSPFSSFTKLLQGWKTSLNSFLPLYTYMTLIFCSYCLFQAYYFFFQIFPLFVLEVSTGVTSYIIQIISISLTWILQPLQFSLLLFN